MNEDKKVVSNEWTRDKVDSIVRKLSLGFSSGASAEPEIKAMGEEVVAAFFKAILEDTSEDIIVYTIEQMVLKCPSAGYIISNSLNDYPQYKDRFEKLIILT